MSKSGREANPEFMRLLRQASHPEGGSWTVERLAVGIGSGRTHVTLVLLNKPAAAGQRFGTGRGGRTRIKLVKFFETHFKEQAEGMLQALGWNNAGKIVPRGELHVEHEP
jgi:hypothetical protein